MAKCQQQQQVLKQPPVKYKKLHFCQLIRNVTMKAAQGPAAGPFSALKRVCHLIKKRKRKKNNNKKNVIKKE